MHTPRALYPVEKPPPKRSAAGSTEGATARSEACGGVTTPDGHGTREPRSSPPDGNIFGLVASGAWEQLVAALEDHRVALELDSGVGQ